MEDLAEENPDAPAPFLGDPPELAPDLEWILDAYYALRSRTPMDQAIPVSEMKEFLSLTLEERRLMRLMDALEDERRKHAAEHEKKAEGPIGAPKSSRPKRRAR